MQYLSCAPSFLYPAGPHEEPHLQDALLSASLSRAGQSAPHSWVYNPEEITRTRSPLIVTDNDDWRRYIVDRHAQLPTVGAGSMLCVLNDVYINNNALYFGGSPETTMLYEMHRPADRAATAINHNIGIRPSTNYQCGVDRRSYFFVTAAGVENYGHWLVDDLPRLRAVELMIERAPFSRPTILLTSHSPAIDDVRLASVRAHRKLSDVEVLFLDKATNYHFDQIFYASPVSYHPVMKLREALNYVRQSYPRRTPPLEARRLFVTRAASSGRRIANFDEIERYFKARDFEFVDCVSLSFQDQVEHFSSADLIVGVMGAAMTNTIFSPPGAAVINLSCAGWPEPFYEDLAQGCAHRSVSVYGTPIEAGAPHNVPFLVDPSQVDEAMALIDA